MATAVTEQSFEDEVLQSDKPVIVDFWAEWCGPCHAVSPVLDRIVDERNGELKLVKVNIDEQPALQQRFGIQSIPTIILFRDGEPAAAVTIEQRCQVAVHQSSLRHVIVSQSASPARAVGAETIRPTTRPSHQPMAPFRSVIPTTSRKPAIVAKV